MKMKTLLIKKNLPKDANIATGSILSKTPIELKIIYRVKWDVRVVPHMQDHEDFDSREEAEKKFLEVAKNYYYVRLIEIACQQKVAYQIYGSHV